MILRTFKALTSRYSELSPGDVYMGNLPYASLKSALLVDLMERGIRLVPSPLARILNASKAGQAEILAQWMLPGTRVICRRADLLEAARRYSRDGIGKVVTKQDRMHCGHGTRRWESLETLYNVVSLLPSAYPFVMQPYLEAFTDVRVILVGDYMEAYVRANPDNFRQNLSAGGRSRPFSLSKAQEEFCRSAMARGGFPFAHLDLQILDAQTCYLSEIALNGGITGASIDRKTLNKKKQDLLESQAKTLSQGEKG